MNLSGVRHEMRAPDLLRAAGVSGQAICEVPFATILVDGNESAIPANPGAYIIVTVANGRVVGIGSTGSAPKKTGTLAGRMGTFVAAALSGICLWWVRTVLVARRVGPLEPPWFHWGQIPG